jgi:hypothetical protein
VTGGRSPRHPAESRDAPQRDPAQRRAESAAERIRREASGPGCSCVRSDVLTPEGPVLEVLRQARGGRVVTKKPTIVGISLSAVVGDQLAFETHPDAPTGETETDLGDLNVEAADEAMERLVAAVMAAAAKSRPCRCLPGPLVLEAEDEPTCARCGRAVEVPS